ncbi:hypothetical protein B0H67DRAFT_558219 [Lasiosphaeris hirsuta]|uniref:Uncharacterized protein n=1 Tax=Lasiosphaeris hirsuta TaxID=260670 RepID=A0AA39ZXW4_9PEZI|nr:hypothetical protein B0H67DRAFT_558219 [Lasiosphaeris hirsuta]
MLSHLRFHRRAPSNPTSPVQVPDQPLTWETAALHDHPQSAEDVSPRPETRPRLETRPRSSNSSQLPPILPPITRVTSDSDLSFEVRDDVRPVSQDSRMPPARPAYDGANGGSFSFIGGLALQNYRRGAQGTQRPESAGAIQSQLPETQLSRAKPPPPPINTGFSFRSASAISKQPKSSSSFVTPTDLQQNAGGATGKRPAGTRLATEPATPSAPAAAPEAQKGKKGLPFLKNPMSTLLMRRRTGHSATDLQPLQFSAEPSYDPRIRGTRVHDFSAPRPRRVVSSADAVTNPVPRPDSAGDYAGPPAPRAPGVSKGTPQPYGLDHGAPWPNLTAFPLADKALPEQPLPAVPPKDDSSASLRTSSSLTSRAGSVNTSVLLNSTSSVRTTASRNLSVSSASVRDSMSALPKHMKSTSSRFSFDMIGAANQEKLLEERHRMRENDKKATDVVAATGQRDSRFDEFDEDSFDYDAMMDDDGLEERIPGVNADYEEDDGFEAVMDPDDDQENFAGFVFQRSNPASSLASPHTPGMLATPRDAEGKAIGFAMTKDATPIMPNAASSFYLQDPSISPGMVDGLSDLHIHELNMVAQSANDEVAVQQPPETAPVGLPPAERHHDDDLYFDEGLADELDFQHDGAIFDESIFDINDTDKYGRPIPGAFAQAKEAMQAACRQPSNRDSDVNSQSTVSRSTAHTSLSAGLQLGSAAAEKEQEDFVSPRELPSEPPTVQSIAIPGQDLAYQAALAEAAQKAAASGKFRRSSSPPPLPAELTITSPTDSSESRKYSDLDGGLEDYEDDPFSATMDDFDFDDEAIIAEANASALASDADGFYGQEFGFYSAPLQQSQPHHSHHSSTSSAAGATGPNAPLSAENLFQYANGGYFGPAGQGLARTTSGRVVSREPNLTPITERSEYSNRNSIMSLALPPPLGSGDGRSSSAASMSSPGLAQLAMLSSDDTDVNMSLSALMKLRSRAWGGSQASVGSSREGSPRSERAGLPPNRDAGAGSPSPAPPWSAPPMAGAGFVPHAHGHARRGSAFSMWSNSDTGSGAGSPTLTVAPLALPLPLPLSSPVPAPAPPLYSPAAPPGNSCSPVLEGDEVDGELRSFDDLMASDPAGRAGPCASPEPMADLAPAELAPAPPVQSRRPGMGHRHKGSADSISYTKEEEPESGGTR